MKLAVTVTAQRRPEHLLRCLRSIDTAWVKIMGESEQPYVSIDESPVPGELTGVYKAAVDFCGNSSRIRINAPAFGLWERKNNAFQTYSWALSESHADIIVALEDDCVLSPDALYLCDWFLTLPNRDDYLFLNLAQVVKTPETAGCENVCVESTRLLSPWAWCFTAESWQKIKAYWQCKTMKPTGWDWSVSYACAINGWKSLTPVLPRAKNIGRELGANGGADIYDATWGAADQAFSDGSWTTDPEDFRLVKSAAPLTFTAPEWAEEAKKDGVRICA